MDMNFGKILFNLLQVYIYNLQEEKVFAMIGEIVIKYEQPLTSDIKHQFQAKETPGQKPYNVYLRKQHREVICPISHSST